MYEREHRRKRRKAFAYAAICHRHSDGVNLVSALFTFVTVSVWNLARSLKRLLFQAFFEPPCPGKGQGFRALNHASADKGRHSH
jgi:succinate dehydrogenase/fumarate reductase cytochrome b subunit